MLDQSFSYENFRIILDVENRKGNYLENKKTFKNADIFQKSRDITEKKITLNKRINEEFNKLPKKHLRKKEDYKAIDDLNIEKEKLIEERETILEAILLELGKITNNENYKIEIKKGQIKFDNQLYTVESKPEHFFVLKQLQRNLYKTFKVKQANRKDIISQLKLILDDGFPKVIVRTDIESFYESIPHKELLSKIDENSLLSYPSKKIIKDILNQYWKILVSDGIKTIDDERVGVPRGIGISAYLSELYLRDFDKKIATYPNVTYYCRYVDDIIIVITPENRRESKSILNYKAELKSMVLKSTRLNINASKTSILDLRKENKDRKKSKDYELNYLGYKFIIGYKKTTASKIVSSTDIPLKLIKNQDKFKSYNDKIGMNTDDYSLNLLQQTTTEHIERKPLKILMSDKKYNRYIDKIKTSFEDFTAEKLKFPNNHNSINRLLLQRIKFLTNNYQLVRRKDNVFVGVYYSNEFINDLSNLIELDKVLQAEIEKIVASSKPSLIDRLQKLSFYNGFNEKSFLNFNFRAFQNEKILKIWKKL
ncbi:antiviral reverse transcriptase Drt3a [Flavobacterium sp. UBA4854]|uniref:antiviral reverse transcriptase Drt3a n=1 Tax=Flavobacterium sp. UBA4854 TaxID=1946548 RepID=UPI00257B35A5|nr:antiviral reverse transcriptase Drt3a [Flavobacterium sp. UBA4854]